MASTSFLIFAKGSILRACPIQISEIDAHPSEAVGFFDKYNVGNSFKVLAFPDEALVYELLHLHCVALRSGPICLFL